MTGLFRRPLRALALVCAVSALAACAQPPVPKDSFYRLEVATPTAPAGAPVFPGKAEVRPLNADGVLLQRAVAFVPEDSDAIEQYSYHFWSGPPAALVQRALADALRAANLFETVVTPEIRVRTDYEVQGRLARFEQVLSGGAPRFVVELDLTVTEKRGMALLLMKTYRAEVPAETATVAAAVDAARQALGDIFAEVATDLRALR